MSYNPIPDLLIMAVFLIALGVVMYVTRKPKRGAEEATLKDIGRFQAERRVRMEDGDYD